MHERPMKEYFDPEYLQELSEKERFSRQRRKFMEQRKEFFRSPESEIHEKDLIQKPHGIRVPDSGQDHRSIRSSPSVKMWHDMPDMERRDPGMERRDPGMERRDPGMERRDPGMERRDHSMERRLGRQKRMIHRDEIQVPRISRDEKQVPNGPGFKEQKSSERKDEISIPARIIDIPIPDPDKKTEQHEKPRAHRTYTRKECRDQIHHDREKYNEFIRRRRHYMEDREQCTRKSRPRRGHEGGEFDMYRNFGGRCLEFVADHKRVSRLACGILRFELDHDRTRVDKIRRTLNALNEQLLKTEAILMYEDYIVDKSQRFRDLHKANERDERFRDHHHKVNERNERFRGHQVNERHERDHHHKVNERNERFRGHQVNERHERDHHHKVNERNERFREHHHKVREHERRFGE
eukprot:UN22527